MNESGVQFYKNKLSIFLIAYHADRWLPNCLESLAKSTPDKIHLVLIDNTGNTILHQLDYTAFQLELLKTPHPMGFAEANNFALTEARQLSDYIIFLNQDTISQPGWLDRCVDCLEQAPELGAVSPVIRNYDDTAYDPSFLDCLPERKIPDPDGRDWLEVVHTPAPALVVRKKVLMQTGPFDPIFGSYYEDYDLCHRIQDAGYKIGICRSAVIQHYSGSATNNREKELRRMRQILRNRLIYKLRVSSKARWQVLLGYFLIEMPHRLLRGLLRTTSSQPPQIVFQASRDILKIIGRIISERKDQKAWQQYLHKLNWQSVIRKTTPEIEGTSRQ